MTAADRFITLNEEIGQMLARLTEASEDFFDVEPETVNWGHVGNLEEIRAKLKLACAVAFNEEEKTQ